MVQVKREMDTLGTNLFLSKPTLANVTIVADKKTPDARRQLHLEL